MRRRSSRHQTPLAAELFVAPIAAFLLLLCLFFWTPSSQGERARCVCGADLGPLEFPTVQGPDPLQRAPVIWFRKSEGIVTLDGLEVDTLPHPDDEPDWKIARLTEQLEVKKHNQRLADPSAVYPSDVLLQVPRGLAAKDLRYALYSAGLAGATRAQLMLRGYTAANFRIVRSAQGDALRLESFHNVEELARAMVALRLEGKPVRVAVFP